MEIVRARVRSGRIGVGIEVIGGKNGMVGDVTHDMMDNVICQGQYVWLIAPVRCLPSPWHQGVPVALNEFALEVDLPDV